MTSKSKKLSTRQQWAKHSMTMAILTIKEQIMGYLKASKTLNVPKTILIQQKNKPLQEVINLKLIRKATYLLAPEDNNEDDDSDKTFVDETGLIEPMVNLPQSSGYDKISVTCEETINISRITNHVPTLIQLSMIS